VKITGSDISISRNCCDLGCLSSRSSVDCNLFQMGCFVIARFLLTSASRGRSAIAELLAMIYNLCNKAGIPRR